MGRTWLVLLVGVVALTIGVSAAQAQEAPTAPARISESRITPEGDLVTLTLEPESQVAILAPCGQVGYIGRVKKDNLVGVNLWTWRALIKVSYCNYKVTGIVYFFSEPVSSCCSWGYQGQVAKQVQGVGTAYIQAYIKGHFRACIPVPFLPDICDSDYPWIVARINGNGLLTAFDWGY